MQIHQVHIELEPHEGQQKVLDSDAKFKILCCGRRWGKSLICQLISLRAMFEGKKVAYITPTNSLGKEFYREMLKLLKRSGMPDSQLKINGTDLRIEIIGYGVIEFYSGEPEALEKRIRGNKFSIAIVDEAAKITDLENAWINVILPTLIDFNGDAFLVSTPRGKNYFYELYQKGLRLEDDYESWNYATHDNPHLPAAAIERMKQTMPPSSYRQEMLAIPSENEDNPFPADKIIANTVNSLSNKETIVFGIDLGRKNDPTVIIGMDEDGYMTYYKSLALGMSWPDQAQLISELPSHIAKVIDSTGVGDPFIQFLEEMNVKQLRRFQFNSTSKMNMIKQLILDVCNDQVKFNEQVAQELFTMEQRDGQSDRIKYEAQAGFHDDRVMALGMANNYRRKEYVKRNWQLYSF